MIIWNWVKITVFLYVFNLRFALTFPIFVNLLSILLQNRWFLTYRQTFINTFFHIFGFWPIFQNLTFWSFYLYLIFRFFNFFSEKLPTFDPKNLCHTSFFIIFWWSSFICFSSARCSDKRETLSEFEVPNLLWSHIG